MKRWWLLCATLCLAACDQELPTNVGGDLLPPGTIRTFEVFVEGDRVFAFDTAFGEYSLPADADFIILANTFEGALNSRMLVRYTIPTAIPVVDAAGLTRTDSTPVFIGGHIRLFIDTVASTRTPAQLQVFRSTESWDRETATWTYRVDTTGVQLRWAQPGGSPGVLAGTASFSGADTLVALPVDSATIAAWRDTTNAARGAVVGSATPDTRLRSALPMLVLRARSAIRPDTIFEVSVAPQRTFIFEPEQPDSVPRPRVGGTPGWRTVLRLRERLDTITVACPGTPGCRVRLSQTAVASAVLLLQPEPAPPGFRPELKTQITAYSVLPTSFVPLQRAPLSEPVGGTLLEVPVSSFIAPNAPPVELELTTFLAAGFAAPSDPSAPAPTTHLALLQTGTTRTFGFATFADRPRLRLVLSITREFQLP